MLWPGFEATWPLMVTPDQAVFTGPEKDMSLATTARSTTIKSYEQSWRATAITSVLKRIQKSYLMLGNTGVKNPYLNSMACLPLLFGPTKSAKCCSQGTAWESNHCIFQRLPTV